MSDTYLVAKGTTYLIESQAGARGWIRKPVWASRYFDKAEAANTAKLVGGHVIDFDQAVDHDGK